MKKAFASVEEYIASQPEASQDALRKVRAAIRKAVPLAAEPISYNIPAYRMPNARVLYFAGWKKHYSVYPASREMLRDIADERTKYKVVKSTIQFPFTAPVPAQLIGRLARFRAAEQHGSRER